MKPASVHLTYQAHSLSKRHRPEVLPRTPRTLELAMCDAVQLAGKLAYMVQSLIPDPEQPPAHEMMMKHILEMLADHPENPGLVYRAMTEEQFQNKWVCVEAVCDAYWLGTVWLVDGKCSFCAGMKQGDIGLCSQVKPRTDQLARYREFGTVFFSSCEFHAKGVYDKK
ncbi:hypothetical protein B0H63DRAFT_443462 [Podospora didyma]|uniref:Uncharacterized protein n=1 Tax=Podospora didyma TaxID=330526 RepID=A0AAE0P4L4_9PEZI|nr:hypothetical protein B0H63DRAFT_443462 [Podospora didyma]